MFHVAKNLYRGPAVDLATLQKAGIKHKIVLQSGVRDFLTDGTSRQYPHEYGIKEWRVTMSDFTPPKREDVLEAIRIIKLAESLGELVYIHCLHGKDRTGITCAAYRMIEQGYLFDGAVEEMYKMGFHKVPYIWWVPSLRQYEGMVLPA